MKPEGNRMFSNAEMSAYERDGFVIARGLFSTDECASLREHYMAMRARGSYPGDASGTDIGAADPMKKFPRMIHMHRWDDTSLRFLLDSRLNRCLTALHGREPYAVQTMLYFKPPGARGQALHQDQVYLRVQPGTCIAAWMALDDSDEENGCMKLVPGSHKLPMLCTQPADPLESISDLTVPVPAGMRPVSALMKAGDVLFFNGFVIHGSFHNRSSERFRRSLIGHYALGEAQRIASFFKPVLRMDGSEIELAESEGGGPCGRWVERDGSPMVEMVAGVPMEERHE
jgi:phytanoyl-CoA hydroxylase